jgi:hypothetical protein
MLGNIAPTSPPTITIANGRCESEPIPCESAAGNSPSVATSVVIGRRRRPCRLHAIDVDVDVRLPENSKYTQVFDPFDLPHYRNDLVRLVFQCL